MDLAKIADGAEVRPIVADNGSERQIAFAGGVDFSAGADTHGIGIDQERDHHGDVEGRLATELPGVILVERGEVELADEINQEKDQVVFGQCVPRRDRIVAVLLDIPGTVSLAVAIHDRAPRSHAKLFQTSGKRRLCQQRATRYRFPDSPLPRRRSFPDRLLDARIVIVDD